MAGKKNAGLDLWLELGRKVSIGGREFHLMPLPLSRLRKALAVIDDRIAGFVKDFVIETDKGEMNVLRLISDVMNSFDAGQVVYDVLTFCKDPDTGEPINKVTKEWLDDVLDIPTLRKVIVEFVEVNEVEDIIKKAQSLPMVSQLLDAMKMTYGLALLKSSRQSTDSAPVRSESSPSPKSTDTSTTVTSETQDNFQMDRVLVTTEINTATVSTPKP